MRIVTGEERKGGVDVGYSLHQRFEWPLREQVTVSDVSP